MCVFKVCLSLQPAVLDNLMTSMKFVLHGMGVLRINLANSKNKVCILFALKCLTNVTLNVIFRWPIAVLSVFQNFMQYSLGPPGGSIF